MTPYACAATRTCTTQYHLLLIGHPGHETDRTGVVHFQSQYSIEASNRVAFNKPSGRPALYWRLDIKSRRFVMEPFTHIQYAPLTVITITETNKSGPTHVRLSLTPLMPSHGIGTKRVSHKTCHVVIERTHTTHKQSPASTRDSSPPPRPHVMYSVSWCLPQPRSP